MVDDSTRSGRPSRGDEVQDGTGREGCGAAVMGVRGWGVCVGGSDWLCCLVPGLSATTPLHLLLRC